MSWVLILTPESRGPHATPLFPAIIGGYPTREQAEAAGKVATFDGIDKWEQEFSHPVWTRQFDAYTVIPGAADTPPANALEEAVEALEAMVGEALDIPS